MPNLNYKRSRSREYKVFHDLQENGYLAFRTAGSHGFADVVGIKATDCGHADHFQVRFIQIKVSKNLKKPIVKMKVEPTIIGDVNLEWLEFPVKERNAK